MYEIRVKYFGDVTKGGPFLTITFSKIYKDQFYNKHIKFCKKGPRLYFKEDSNGFKCTNNGVVKITKGAQDYSQFEGEYDIKVDRITERYYVDLEQVRLLGNNSKEVRITDKKHEIEPVNIEDNVIKYLRNLVIELAENNHIDDIIFLANTINIIKGRKDNGNN